MDFWGTPVLPRERAQPQATLWYSGIEVNNRLKAAILHQVTEVFRAVEPGVTDKKLITGKVMMLPEIFHNRF